jgi:hypothetical protein
MVNVGGVIGVKLSFKFVAGLLQLATKKVIKNRLHP